MHDATGHALTLPKSSRVRKRAEFVRIQTSGVKIEAGCLMARASKRASGETRLGITISSKVGNAVVRNRVRRRVREAFRLSRAQFPPGVDIIFIAKSKAHDATYEVLRRDVESVRVDLMRRFS